MNELAREFEAGVKVGEIQKILNKQANLYTVNGYPVEENYSLKSGDRLVFIQKGKIPKFEELEAMMQARHTPRVYEVLKKKKVLLIGLGGLGSVIAISLARIGVGTIVGVDYDIVEPSNLNRQQYFIRHIGMKKTAAMAELLKEINPFIHFEPYDEYVTPENLMTFIKDADIVIEAVDQDVTKAMIVENVLSLDKHLKVISASGMAGYFDSNHIQTRQINERFYVCGDGVNGTKPGSGLMAPRVGIAAHHQANLAVQLLLQEEEI